MEAAGGTLPFLAQAADVNLASQCEVSSPPEGAATLVSSGEANGRVKASVGRDNL